jgi:hypothetical protein
MKNRSTLLILFLFVVLSVGVIYSASVYETRLTPISDYNEIEFLKHCYKSHPECIVGGPGGKVYYSDKKHCLKVCNETYDNDAAFNRLIKTYGIKTLLKTAEKCSGDLKGVCQTQRDIERVARDVHSEKRR